MDTRNALGKWPVPLVSLGAGAVLVALGFVLMLLFGSLDEPTPGLALGYMFVSGAVGGGMYAMGLRVRHRWLRWWLCSAGYMLALWPSGVMIHMQDDPPAALVREIVGAGLILPAALLPLCIAAHFVLRRLGLPRREVGGVER